MFDVIRKIKLTIAQWGLLTLTGIVGFLVLALRLQGSKLHKAKVDLLKAQIQNQIDRDDQNVIAKKAAYDKAREEYEKS